MNQVFVGQNNKISALFFISIILYIFSSYYKVDAANTLFESREVNKNFVIKLSKEFKKKAGIIISKQNFDPILPNTLLSVILKTPDNYIENYIYDESKLIISATKNSNIIDIRDIIKYLVINKSQNDFILYLK